MEKICNECKFWHEDLEDDFVGQCRINPPALLPTAFYDFNSRDMSFERVRRLSNHTEWPVTGYEAWCGKWERR